MMRLLTAWRTSLQQVGALAVLLAFASAARGEWRDDPAEAPPPAKAPDREAWLARMNVREAWEITRGAPGVLVGVIDNGFDSDHPDLKGRLVPGCYYSGGYHPESYDNLAHGTLVASLIVAKGD